MMHALPYVLYQTRAAGFVVSNEVLFLSLLTFCQYGDTIDITSDYILNSKVGVDVAKSFQQKAANICFDKLLEVSR